MPDELRSVSPPGLLVRPPINKGAERRFHRLAEIGSKLKLLPDLYIRLNRNRTKGTARRFLARLVALDRNPMSLVRILEAKGFIQCPIETNLDFWKELPRIKMPGRILEVEADLALRAGDSAACAELMGQELSYVAYLRRMIGPFIPVQTAEELDSWSMRTVLKCSRQGLSRNEIRALLPRIAPIGPTDPRQVSALREEFQAVLLHLDSATRSYQLGQAFDGRRGSFDAIETARTLGLLYSALVHNATRDWSHQSHRARVIADQAETDLPDDLQLEYDRSQFMAPLNEIAAGLEGSTPQDAPKRPSKLTLLLNLMQLNLTPNVVGRRIIQDEDLADFVPKQSIALSTTHELVRAVLAIRLFAADHGGRFPHDLSNLVTARYLPSLPMDWFACAPLRYDAKRRIVYSLGPSCVDHHGNFKAELRPDDDSDFGAFIDQPPKT